MTTWLWLLVPLLLQVSHSETVEDCELSFLQTERIVSRDAPAPAPAMPWLAPAFEHVTVPDVFAHVASPPMYFTEGHISLLGKVGTGLGAVLIMAVIAWSFGEDRSNGQEQHGDSPHFWRMFIALMCMIMYLLNYADRYNISVAIIKISQERGYDKRVQGFIQSAVYFGLLPGNLAFGHLASPDVLGAFNTLLVACICWSFATVLTPFCADSSLGLWVFIRIALGFFEAASAPCTYQLAQQWFPKMQAGHLLASAVTGQCAGAAIANAFGAMNDWRIVFYVFSSCGFAWCAVFLSFGSDTPETHSLISKDELYAIHEQQREEKSHQMEKNKDGSRPMSLLALVRQPVVLGLMVGEFTYAFLWFFWLSWMPSFFHDAFGLSTGDAGALGMISYIVGMPAPFLWSKLFGSCFKRNGPSSLLNLRLLFICITFLGAMLGNALMLLTYSLVSPTLAMLLVMIVIVALCAKVSGQSALVVDCGGSANSARVGGLMHTAAAVSGSVSNLVVGYFLDTPNLGYLGVFTLTILVSCLGLATVVQTAQVDVIRQSEESK